jgi:transposase-like protein
MGMQRVFPCELTPEAYIATEAHRQVRAELVCPRCEAVGTLHHHGTYARGITTALGRIVVILIARFLCPQCGRTVSYLPDFALSYRLVQTATFEAFLNGEWARRDVQTWTTLLQNYRRRMRGYAATVRRVVGACFGRAPPAADLWSWLKEACGSVTAATRRLVADFRITLFHRYQCHQPARPA